MIEPTIIGAVREANPGSRAAASVFAGKSVV